MVGDLDDLLNNELTKARLLNHTLARLLDEGCVPDRAKLIDHPFSRELRRAI